MNKKQLRSFLLAVPGFQSLCRLLSRGHVRVLMYHRFCEDGGGGEGLVTPRDLRRHVAYLRKNHSVWRPEDQLAALRSEGGAAAECPVVLTIDDGYADFFHFAFPVLKETGAPAMLFVTTGFVDGTSWMWWDRLRFILENGRPSPLKFHFAPLGRELDLTTPRGRLVAWHWLGDHCRFVPDGEKNRVLAELAERLEVTVPDQAPGEYAASTWAQIREMGEAAILFGAHTLSHPILTRLDSDEARREIAGSKERLEEMTGQAADWFCYPQGGPSDYSPEVRDLVEEAGFQGCYIAYQSPGGNLDPFVLSRYPVSADWVDFRWKLCGAEHLVTRLRESLFGEREIGDRVYSEA